MTCPDCYDHRKDMATMTDQTNPPEGLPEGWRKTWACADFLPDPGPGVVRNAIRALGAERKARDAAEARVRDLERVIVERHPVGYAYVERARRHDQELQVCIKERDSLRAQVARLTEQRNALQAEVESLRLQAEMACIDPRPDCGCSGCQYANEVNGHE